MNNNKESYKIFKNECIHHLPCNIPCELHLFIYNKWRSLANLNPTCVATLSLGLATKARGLQGYEPRERPKNNVTSSHECKECEGMNLHTPKWIPMLGIGIPNGLPNLQSVILGVKTHHLEDFFISLKNYWNLNV